MQNFFRELRWCTWVPVGLRGCMGGRCRIKVKATVRESVPQTLNLKSKTTAMLKFVHAPYSTYT